MIPSIQTTEYGLKKQQLDTIQVKGKAKMYRYNLSFMNDEHADTADQVHSLYKKLFLKNLFKPGL